MVDTLSGTAPLFPSGLLSQILLPVSGQRLTELTVEDCTLEGCRHKGLGAARERLGDSSGPDRYNHFWVKEPFKDFNEQLSNNGL